MARDGAMRTDASARTRRVVLLVASLGVASAAWAGAEGFPAVSAAEQAERDARRVAILQGELASETAALARAETRRAERAAANDLPGVLEAEQAREEHARNLAALRAEIERATAKGASPATRERRPVPAASAKSARPWWDAYGSPP